MSPRVPDTMFVPASGDKKRLCALRDALDLLGEDVGRVAIIADTGEQIPIPPSALVALRTIVAGMAADDAIALTTYPERLSIGRAATLLNASRAHVTRLIEAGKLELIDDGTPQRLALQDVLDYRARSRQRSREALAELLRISEEAGLDAVA